MAYEQHADAARAIAARCAVVTVSDTRTADTDKSGRRISDLLKAAGHPVVHYQVVPDEEAALEMLIVQLLERADVDAVLTNGGTGISRRDRTIEVVERLLERPLPGFGELFRWLSWDQISSGAMLSRAVGGVAKGKVLFALPGSTAAVDLGMSRLILPEIRHLIYELRK